MVDNITAPLTQAMIKKFHYLLTYGTYADRQHKLSCGEFRTTFHHLGAAPGSINTSLSELIKDYERHPADLERILDFHVKFEAIHPFQDGNGRVGRLLMLKECLKNGIMPFVIAEGLRKFYYLGLDEWRQNRRARLMDVCLTGQDVFKTTTANLLSKTASNTKYA
jgi:Fic family protein